MLKFLSQLFSHSPQISSKLRLKVNLRIELNFTAVAQAMYKVENDHNHIERFYSNVWEKDIFPLFENFKSVKLKTFINTSNLHHHGQVRLFISVDDRLVTDKTFFVDSDEEHSGWLELSYYC